MSNAVVVLLSVVALAGAGNVLSGRWKELSGRPRLKTISKGDAGIWSVDNDGNAYQYDWESRSWNLATGRDVELVHITSGAMVWGADKWGQVFRRNPEDSGWTRNWGSQIRNIDTSNKGRTWAVQSNNRMFQWREGWGWYSVDGGAKQVTVGESGVWHVNWNGNMWYRSGTYGDLDTAGSGWEAIDGNMKWISSGKDILVGVSNSDEVFYRAGMSSATPTGTEWVRVAGSLAQIDIDGIQTVGVDGAGKAFQSGVTYGCDCTEVDDDLFELNDIDYDLENAIKSELPPQNVGKKKITNRTSGKQSTAYSVSRTVSETSSFSHTAGASVTVGTTFSVGVPFVVEGEISVSATASYSYTSGKSNTESKTVTAYFNCNAAPKTITECDALMFRDNIEVPFTRTWVQKADPTCICTDKGVFNKITGHRLELEVVETGYLVE